MQEGRATAAEGQQGGGGGAGYWAKLHGRSASISLATRTPWYLARGAGRSRAAPHANQQEASSREGGAHALPREDCSRPRRGSMPHSIRPLARRMHRQLGWETLERTQTQQPRHEIRLINSLRERAGYRAGRAAWQDATGGRQGGSGRGRPRARAVAALPRPTTAKAKAPTQHDPTPPAASSTSTAEHRRGHPRGHRGHKGKQASTGEGAKGTGAEREPNTRHPPARESSRSKGREKEDLKGGGQANPRHVTDSVGPPSGDEIWDPRTTRKLYTQTQN